MGDFFLPARPAAAQGPVSVPISIQPDPLQIAPGGVADVAIRVDGVENLYAIDIGLAFDPLAVEVLDLDPTQPGVQAALGTLLEPGYVIVNFVDNQAGALRLAMTQLTPSLPKNGSGSLVVVRFHALQNSGETPLDLVFAELATDDGQPIPNVLQDGTLQIVESAPGLPNTPIPAQPPGTPAPSPTPAIIFQATPASPDIFTLMMPLAAKDLVSAPPVEAPTVVPAVVTEASPPTPTMPPPTPTAPAPSATAIPRATESPAPTPSLMPSPQKNEASLTNLLAALAVLVIATALIILGRRRREKKEAEEVKVDQDSDGDHSP